MNKTGDYRITKKKCDRGKSVPKGENVVDCAEGNYRSFIVMKFLKYLS